jgi:hypothetical protein
MLGMNDFYNALTLKFQIPNLSVATAKEIPFSRYVATLRLKAYIYA